MRDRDGKPDAPVAQSETQVFTDALASYYTDTHFFRWLYETSYGVEASTNLRDWSAYWNGVTIQKRGGAITFRHDAGASPENMWISSSRILGQMSAAYLWSSNRLAAKLAEQYAKGLSATMLGMAWDANDPLRSIMARAVIAKSHTILREGKTAFVDYDAWRTAHDAWNTQTIFVAQNPYWPEAWVQNTRSKDDVPHIYLATAILPHLASFADDLAIRTTARETYDLMRGFTKDVAEHGYWIRSKRADGSLFYPGLYPSDDRLSTISNFAMSAVYPKVECPARLATALIADERPHGEDCGDGLTRAADLVGAEGNFYNYEIQATFHLAAAMIASEQGLDADALVRGLWSRADFDLNLKDDEIPGGEVAKWRGKLAVFIVYAAAAGMPVPAHAIRFVYEQFSVALARLRTFPAYDPWSLPDGDYPLHPKGEVIGTDAVGAFFWYCWSPYRAAGDPIVDCDRLRSAVAASE